ncbi:MAG: hypothetical protein EPO26_11155 [Chloroflexota bacterium]|nr:MAG: hypothetical protein EPO26_11155 [Chloroflexota bacterium]
MSRIEMASQAVMRGLSTGLWTHPRFVALWAAQTISHMGTHVGALALTLTAILILNATPAQMGVLGAARFLPQLFVSLFAGALVDRLPRRPIMIAADLARAALLLSIPVAAA